MTKKDKEKNVREFEFEGKTYKVRKPNNKIKKASESFYARAYREALSSGFFLEAEIEEVLRMRGFTDKEINKKKNIIVKDIRSLEVKLVKEDYEDDEDGKSICFDIMDKRAELDAVDSARQELNSQVASSIAENQRFSYYAYGCTTDENGNSLWSDYDEFENDESPLAVKCATELMMLIYNITLDSSKEFDAQKTENVWLKSKGMMNEDLRLINSDGHLVDREDRLINEEGQFVDCEGNRIDIFGNTLDDEGNLQFKEPEKAEPKKRGPKKTSTAVAEEPVAAN